METCQAGEHEVCYERGRIWALEGCELIIVKYRDSGGQEMGAQQMGQLGQRPGGGKVYKWSSVRREARACAGVR